MRQSLREIACYGDRIHTIVHGPLGCVTDFGSPTKNPSVSCTALNESDIIMGGEDKLEEAILRAAKQNPRLIIVLHTCPTVLIGDRAPAFDRIPLIEIETSGLSGIFSWSEKNITLPRIIPFLPKQEKDAYSVNIFGNEWFHSPEELRATLKEIGINTPYIHGTGDRIFDIPKAEINIFFDRDLQRIIGGPLESAFSQRSVLSEVPFGIRKTGRLILRIAKYFGRTKEAARQIKILQAGLKAKIKKHAPELIGKEMIIQNRDYASALAELGVKASFKEGSNTGCMSCRTEGIREPEEYAMYNGFREFAESLAHNSKDRFQKRYKNHLQFR